MPWMRVSRAKGLEVSCGGRTHKTMARGAAKYITSGSFTWQRSCCVQQCLCACGRDQQPKASMYLAQVVRSILRGLRHCNSIVMDT